MEIKEWHIGYDVLTNHWEHVEAFTQQEAEQILIKKVSEEHHVPDDQIMIHSIDNY